ncbi:MAG: cytochrome c [bacterium]|nr:cytochrome c [bacterium]
MAIIRKSYFKYVAGITCLGALLAMFALLGCTASRQLAAKPGAQLWGENWGRCHNIRTPSSYSDAQWEIVVTHMRTRANLTSDEADKILEFLKAAN